MNKYDAVELAWFCGEKKNGMEIIEDYKKGRKHRADSPQRKESANAAMTGVSFTLLTDSGSSSMSAI